MEPSENIDESLYASGQNPGIFENASRNLRRIIESATTPLPKEFYCRIQEFFLQRLVFETERDDRGLIKEALTFGCHSILFLASVYTILMSRIKGLKTAHYIILLKNQNNAAHDFRSNEIIEIIPLSSTINFAHCASIKKSLFFIGKIPNLVFLDSIFYFSPLVELTPIPNFTGLDDASLAKIQAFWPSIHKSKSAVRTLGYLIRFLRLDKFIMLDDSRHTGELRLACKENGVKTIGYMHGRFNEFHMGLFYHPFSLYFVWSEYFKDLYFSLTPGASEESVQVTGHFRITQRLPQSAKQNNSCIRVLLLGESNVNFEEVKPYLNELKKEPDISIFFRGKPGTLNASASKYINALGIGTDSAESFIESLAKNNYNVVIGTHSTALMECYMQGTPGLVLATSYDYANELVKGRKIFGCNSPADIVDTIKKVATVPKSEVMKMAITLWGNDYCFKPHLLREQLLK